MALGRRVDRLLTEDGAVVGGGVGDDTLTAGAVVVATGGFGTDPEKLARYFPSAAETGWAWYIGAPGSRGDHLDFAAQVGAQVTRYDRGLRLLHADFARIYEAYLPGWLMLVDRQGRRFCDETAPYGIMDGLTHDRGDVAYVIFDRAALDEATAAGVARYKQRVPGSTKKQSPHWNTDIVESMVTAGKVHRAGPSLSWPRGSPCPQNTWRRPSSGTTRPWRRGRTSITSRTPSSSSRSRPPRSTRPRSARRPCALPPAACGSIGTLR